MEEFLAAEKRVSIASYGESCVLPPGGLVLYSVYSPRLYCLCMNCIFVVWPVLFSLIFADV